MSADKDSTRTNRAQESAVRDDARAGGTPADPAPPDRPRMTISRALEMALLNRQARQPSVKILVSEGRVVGAEVFAAHDDIEEAERQARIVAESILSDYPGAAPAPERHKVSLTRNAKGETQIDIEGRWTTLEDVMDFAEVYNAVRGRYPLADGTATHDAPRKAAAK